jgi:signal transduction histidine kinase
VFIFVFELILNMSGQMIQLAWGERAGIVVDQSTFLYQIYVAISGIFIAAGIFKLIRMTKNTRIKKEKNRNRLLIIGFFQAALVIAISNIFFRESSEIQMLTPISLLIMAIMVGYAIVKYQFFDIKAAVLRTFAYVLSLFTLSAIYYGLAYLLSVFIFKNDVSSSFSVSPVNVALALVLAFVFQPIKKFFDKYTNKIFYKDSYNSDDFFAKLNKTLGSTIDLRGLLERAAVEIGGTLKSEQTFFFINMEGDHYMTAGTPKHKLLPKADADQLGLAKENKDGVIIASLLDNLDQTRRLMNSHRLELVMPLKKDGEIIGYLCLGEHLTSHYASKDIKVLNAIANSLIIAIQNALAVQEIREFNTTLQQRVASATEELRSSNRMLRQLDKAKDEFVGMASHQLRTPLTSVKGYISMVIDGDAGKITDSQKQLLNEAFNSSERMVSLINDFLNVSRIQTGKFIIEKNTLDLPNLIEQELNNLQPNAAAHGVKFNYIKPTDFPTTIADEGKIRQVVMNFLDNAIYYSPDNTAVDVCAAVQNDEIIFTVKDRGIGVPMSERSQLFTKFYRASNAKRKRPDGTGVGLYLAKKIITDHGGSLIFESTEGKGSTFGFRLPIKKV